MCYNDIYIYILRERREREITHALGVKERRYKTWYIYRIKSVPVAKKMCHRCSQDKPTTEFYKAVRNKDGLHSYCKTCTKEYYLSLYEDAKGKDLAHRSYRKQADRLGVKPQERFRQPDRRLSALSVPTAGRLLPPQSLLQRRLLHLVHHVYTQTQRTGQCP